MSIPIANLSDFNAIRSSDSHTFAAGLPEEVTTNGGLDKDYILIADIDLNGAFEPLGGVWWAESFTGSLDGDGYKIHNGIIDYDGDSAVGIIGNTNGAEIKNIIVENVAVTGWSEVGILIGSVSGGSISDCSVSGEAISAGGAHVGGLFGDAWGGVIERCESRATITSEGTFGQAGGLCGNMANGTMVTDCCASGDVDATGTDQVGGLIGQIEKQAGYDSCAVTNCYARGAVTGSSDVGGLIGLNQLDDATITSCYYDEDTTGQSDEGKGEPKTTAEMKDQDTFTDWDFVETWYIFATVIDGYPHLRYFYSIVESISLHPVAAVIAPDDCILVEPYITPADSPDKRIQWNSSDYNVATVIERGDFAIIYGHSEGTATITAISIDGEKSASVIVTIEDREEWVYESLKVLSPFSEELHEIDNQEIIDLTIKRELSGHYGLDFILPADAIAAEYIVGGRYIETEGQKYIIETVTPTRGADGNPLILIHCTHIFFDSEKQIITKTEEFRGNILEHLRFVLKGSGVVIVGRSWDSGLYSVTRNIEYTTGDSQLEAIKKIFNRFAVNYMLNNMYFEVLPDEAITETGVIMEYALNNVSISKTEDITGVVTNLYAVGGSWPYEVVGEEIGTGTGSEETFQVENYPIISDSELIYFDDILQSQDNYEVDYDTGEITASPANGIVVTIDYYTERGAQLSREVSAPLDVSSIYRRDRIEFVNFGDILIWNNFVYVTDKYLEDRMYPRISYELSVAELKRISNVESAHYTYDLDALIDLDREHDLDHEFDLDGPAYEFFNYILGIEGELQPFHLDIGKTVTVRDAGLGIDIMRPVRSYTYKPLVAQSASSCIIGDKMLDITFAEQRKEGDIKTTAGEWRYDETTGQWIFFPDVPERDRPGRWPGEDKKRPPDIADETDYALTIDVNGDYEVPCRVRWTPADTKYEKVQIVITGTPKSGGNLAIKLGNIVFAVPITVGMSTSDIATAIAAAAPTNWGVDVLSGSKVVFIAQKLTDSYQSNKIIPGPTGITGSVYTYPETVSGTQSPWWHDKLPLMQGYGDGDTVEVEPLDVDDMSFLDWEGDGSGARRRTFTMDSNKGATVNYDVPGLGREFTVVTNDPSDVTTNTATLNGAVTVLQNLPDVEVGFVWGYTEFVTLLYNEGVIAAGTSGIGSFNDSLPKDTDTVYYYRAYAKVTDSQTGAEVVRYGMPVSFRYAVADRFEVIISTDEETAEISPFTGTRWYEDAEEITIAAEIPDELSYTFDKWNINGSEETDNPHTFNITEDTNIKAMFADPHTISIGHSGYIDTSGFASPAPLIKVYAKVDSAWTLVASGQIPLVIPMKYKYIRLEAGGRSVRPGSFDSWEGDGVSGIPGKDGFPPRLITMDSNKDITLVLKDPEERSPLFGYVSTKEPLPNMGKEGDLWFMV